MNYFVVFRLSVNNILQIILQHNRLFIRLFLCSTLEYASHYLCQQCRETSTWFCIINNSNILKHGHNHVLPLIITNNKHVTVIINEKPCACLMALLAKIMRCILQVRAQEQPFILIVPVYRLHCRESMHSWQRPCVCPTLCIQII